MCTYYDIILKINPESLISYLIMITVLRMEWCNSFANAPYGSVEKKLESMGHVCCLYWLFSPTGAFQFFHFTILGEEILVRVWFSRTLVNTEHLPKQYLFTVHCSTHRHDHASQNTDDSEIWSRCQSLLVTLSMDWPTNALDNWTRIIQYGELHHTCAPVLEMTCCTLLYYSYQLSSWVSFSIIRSYCYSWSVSTRMGECLWH